MALTFTLIRGTEADAGRVREMIFDVLLDNSYPSGGWPIAPRDVGMINVVALLVVGTYLTTGVAKTVETALQYDPILQKLQAFESGGAGAAFPEKNEAGGLNTTVVRIKAIGF